MTAKEAKQLEPWDVVLYTPTNEDALVKCVTDCGVFLVFRIQSTAQLCRFEDIQMVQI